MRRFWRIVGVTFTAELLLRATGLAQGLDSSRRSATNLADLSIEELMNESVTSVSKKETRLSESPAAITVITPEDIRRIGATSIPEALRVVPGLEVVRINASEWAVSARGFKNQSARELLVLVDGHLDVDLIDRVEIVRRPSSSIYGSSACFGV